MTTQLSILKTSIRTLDNLYSLTDLHKASGGDEKHKPVLFLRLDQTKDLISEIQNDKVQICTLPVKTVRGGRNPSTYACEELVLSYAMWISPKFHLIVLRAFLAMHKGEAKQQQQNLPLPKQKQTKKHSTLSPTSIILSVRHTKWGKNSAKATLIYGKTLIKNLVDIISII